MIKRHDIRPRRKKGTNGSPGSRPGPDDASDADEREAFAADRD